MHRVDPIEDPERRASQLMADFKALGDRIAEKQEDGWSASARPIPSHLLDDLPPQSEGCKPNPERVAALRDRMDKDVVVVPTRFGDFVIGVDKASPSDKDYAGPIPRTDTLYDQFRTELKPGRVIPVQGNPAHMSDDELLDAVDVAGLTSAPGEFVRTPITTKTSTATTVSQHMGEAMEAEGRRLMEVGRTMQGYSVKDSGERKQFASGMVRDTAAGKIRFDLAFDGPMFVRYADHLTKGAAKYAPRNWMQANGDEELERFRESAVRHFMLWMQGERDEDHAAAVWYNINGYEYVRDRLIADGRGVPNGPQPSA